MTPDLRDLDRAIAEARGETHFSCNYATDSAWTLRLLEEMATAHCCLRIKSDWNLVWEIDWVAQDDPHKYEPLIAAHTLPEAVARAWLAWHEANEKPGGLGRASRSGVGRVRR